MGGSERHLILGGSGFVGRHVALALSRQGHQVVLAARRPPPEFDRFDPALVSWRHHDLLTCDWADLMRDVSVVHHYAWASIPQTAASDPIWDVDQHLRSAVAMLEAASQLSGRRIVFVSSGGTVYGRQGHSPVEESSATHPEGVYGATKLAVENYMRAYHVAGRVDCRVARLSNPYGVGQSLTRGQGVVSTFVNRVLRNEPLTVWGSGGVVRDYLHISDAVDALIAIAADRTPQTWEMPLFNVASGFGTSINDLIADLQEILGVEFAIERLPGRPIDVPVSVLSRARIQNVLGWEPKHSLKSGLRTMIADLRAGAEHYSSLNGPGEELNTPAGV